jgi:hypothetical protein
MRAVRMAEFFAARAAMMDCHPAALPALGLRPDELVVDLALRLRWGKCDAKGEAVVSIR